MSEADEGDNNPPPQHEDEEEKKYSTGAPVRGMDFESYLQHEAVRFDEAKFA